MVRNICHLYMTEDVGGHFERRESSSNVFWILKLLLRIIFCSSIFVTNLKQLTWLIYMTLYGTNNGYSTAFHYGQEMIRGVLSL